MSCRMYLVKTDSMYDCVHHGGMMCFHRTNIFFILYMADEDRFSPLHFDTWAYVLPKQYISLHYDSVVIFPMFWFILKCIWDIV